MQSVKGLSPAIDRMITNKKRKPKLTVLTRKTIELLSAEPIQQKQGLRDHHSTSARVKKKVP